jgi:MFS family permease
VSSVTTERTLDLAGRDAALRPRGTFVTEVAGPDGTFTAAAGPVRGYERRVSAEPVPPATADGTEQWLVRQVVTWDLTVPFFGWILAPAVRARFRRLDEPLRAPWWAPPDVTDAAAFGALATIALLAVVHGYLSTLLTQTITFAADEFNAGTSAQGIALAAVRADVVLTVFIVGLADRRGRRLAVLGSSAAACFFTALGAAAPTLAVLAGSQVLARGCTTAALLLLTIIAAEEMPKGSRAYAVSVLTVTGALGAGTCVVLLRVCDLGPAAWRILYLIPIVGLVLVAMARRRLPVSRRFRKAHVEAPFAGHGRRFWLLAVSGFLLNLFVAPASQFQNEYLRDERGFSAGRLTLFTVATGIPGGLGLVIGGRLAERSRRLVGAVAIVGGVGATVIVYQSGGWPLWAWSVVGSIIGAAIVPSLGVYGPELFPTSLRGRANGIITATARVGSVIGLLVAGWASSRAGRLGPALAGLAVGPAILAILVITAYPETAHRELEELNPEDA